MSVTSLDNQSVTSLDDEARVSTLTSQFQRFSFKNRNEEQDFQAFARLIRQNRQWSTMEIMERVEARWEDEETQDRFLDWRKEQCMQKFQRTVPRLSSRLCLLKIKDTDFFNAARRAEWRWIMEMVFNSFVIIGQATYGGVTTAYGIDPSTSYLLPHDFKPEQHRGGYLLHHSILGIDLRRASSPTNASPGIPSSMRIAPDFDVGRFESDRFIFAQIGSLWAFREPSDQPVSKVHKKAYTESGPWDPTGFGVVVQINEQTGMPGGVFVIYNFSARGKDADMKDFFRPPVRDEQGNILPHIGRLHPRCDPARNFTIAQIAKSISGFIPSSDTKDFSQKAFKFMPAGLPKSKPISMLRECVLSPIREVNVNSRYKLIHHVVRNGPR
ncbi:hypothetical protein CcaCcLH18_04967 [Colletotrichum camelliae]|nr:hypothetical protein CcaCcLH18_04967 [Colletotrichum camelliae]